MESRAGGGLLIKNLINLRKLINIIPVVLFVVFIAPVASYASTPLHDKPAGTIITFSDKQWMILDQLADGTTYIILSSTEGKMVFDSDNTKLLNPEDSNNIGYYLNNTYYNSLSQKDLIENHSWEIDSNQPLISCNIALISAAEYNTYRALFPDNGYGYHWWTRTPCGNFGVTTVRSTGSLYYDSAYRAQDVRPTLYLKSNLQVSDANVVVTNPPATPVNLAANATSYDQAQLTWQVNSEPDLAGYIIFRNYVEIARVGADETSYTDSGLIPTTTYTYGIKAYNTNNISDMSNAATVTTPKPPSPDGLTISDVTVNSALATWEPVSGVDSYNIYLNSSPVYNTTQTQYEITNLTPGGTYTVDVRTVIDGVESEPAILSFTTVLPPAAPILTARSTAYNQVQLSWPKNTEQDLSGYIIYRDYNEIARAEKDATEYIDNGLHPNTEYVYGIEAYNTSNVASNMSNAATVTTQKLPTPVITASVDNRKVSLSWTGLADNFLVVVNGQQVANITDNHYSFSGQPGNYTVYVVAEAGSVQQASAPVNVQVSSIETPGASVMTGDVLNNAGIVLYPAGGLLALALALKASPWIIATAKAGLFKKFF